MWTDPIVAEVRKAREEYARKFDYDIERIAADIRKQALKRAKAAKSKASPSKPAKRKRPAA